MQEHAVGTSCLLHGPITYTIGFHTEGDTGISLHQEIYDVAVASTSLQHIYRLNSLTTIGYLLEVIINLWVASMVLIFTFAWS